MVNLTDLLFFLRQERVVDPAHAEQFAALAKDFPQAKNLLRELARRGWITTYQANQLFQDRGKDLLLGSYVILERLGEGGMGTVYKARHRKLERIVALKVIRSDRLARPDVVRRFQREIRAAAQLDHPHIVHAIDADEVDGTHFLVMEYIDGGIDLSQLVKRNGPLPVKSACEYMRQAALGLQHAFERNLIHRDIKPQNLILVSGQWAVDSEIGTSKSQGVPGDESQQALSTAHCTLPTLKIPDLGLARFDDSATIEQSCADLTKTGVIMGTMDYIAPEQTRDSHQVDIRADLYSLGCTFYYLLTGKVPFPGNDPMAKLIKHRSEQPKAIEARRPNVPTRVTDIVYRLMAKEPKDRYQTPAELAQALANLDRPAAAATAIVKLTPAPSQAVSRESVFSQMLSSGTMLVKTPKPVTPIPRKRLLVASLAGAGLLAILLLILLGPWNQTSRPDRRKSGTDNTDKEEDSPRQTTLEELEAREKREEEIREQNRQAKAEAAFQKLCQKAEKALKPLAARFGDLKTGGEALRKDLLAFRHKYPGTPAALRAAELVMKLPSPLDKLDARKLPRDCIEYWKILMGTRPPKELVGVLGNPSSWGHGQGEGIDISPDNKVVAQASSRIGLFDRVSGKLLRTIPPAGQTINPPYLGNAMYLVYSPDGRTLASTTFTEMFIRLWNVETGRQKAILTGHALQPFQLVWTPDSRTLITSGHDSVVKVWDVITGKTRRNLPTQSQWWNPLAISQDGTTLACLASLKSIRLYNLTTGKEGRVIDAAGDVTGLALSPKTTTLAAGLVDGTVILWDWPTGKQIRRWPAVKNSAQYLAYSPNGKFLAVGASNAMQRGKPQEIGVWEISSGKLFLKTPFPDQVTGLVFSKDNKSLFATCWLRTQIWHWNVTTGKEERPSTGPIGPLTDVAFCSDGETLFTAQPGGSVSHWDIGSGKEKAKKGTHPDSSGFSMSLDGKLVAFRNSSNVFIFWDGAGEIPHFHHRGDLNSSTFSPDGKTLVSRHGNTAMCFWDVKQGKELVHIEENTTCAAFDPTGRIVAAGTSDKIIRLHDAQTGQELRSFEAYSGPISFVAYSPDGKCLLIGGGTEIRLWDRKNNKVRYTLPPGFAVFSPDGKQLAVTAAGNWVRLHDAATGAKLCECQLPVSPNHLSFASDGRHVATANSNGTVYILRLAPPKPLTAGEAKKQ